MPMTIVSDLLRQLEATSDGEPWYGRSRLALLRGVSAEDAAATPVAGAPSIWGTVLHLTAWTREVTRRLQGAAPGEPEEGDWPPVPAATDRAWRQARAALSAAHADLLRVAAGLSARELDLPVGNGVTRGEMLVGLAQHDAYHAGQIALLRKSL
jgi:uncharacterized damage-inducible protein DinB